MFVGASIRFLKKHPPKFRSIEMQPPKVWNAMPRFTGLWMIVVGWLTSPVIILEWQLWCGNFGVANNTIHADLKTELDAVRDQLLDMKRLLKCKDDPWAFCLLQAEKGVGAVAALAHRDVQLQDQKAKALERQKNRSQSTNSTIAMPTLPSGDLEKWKPKPNWTFGANNTIHADTKTELDAVRDQLLDMKRLLKCKDDPWAFCLLQAEKGVGAVAALAHRDVQLQDQKAKALERQKNRSQSTNSIAMPTLPSGDLEKWKPQPNWTNTSFADINIVGFPKAGTSHLYRIIASHPEVERFAAVKEFCLPRNASLEVMFTYSKRLARDRGNRKKTLNGCFRSPEVSRWWLYLRQPQTKVIFIFRDPAAWLWAAFNFWFIDGFDAPPSPRPDWAGPNQHRTSELFHEGIVSGSKTGLGQFLNDFRHMSVVNPRQWIAMLGRDNLLFIKSEDMSPADPSRLGSLTDQISAFIGLTKDGFNKSILGARTNCGDMKGDRQECHAASGTYQISGKREMLPHTKDIIYLQFLEECNIWSKEFDVHYPACLNILHAVGLHGKYNVRVGAVVWLWQLDMVRRLYISSEENIVLFLG